MTTVSPPPEPLHTPRPSRLKWLAVGVLVGVTVGCLLPHLRLRHEATTLLSLSPDDRTRVHLVDFRGFLLLDRNFELRVERPLGSTPVTVFRSPDEGRPEGSERVVWSPDGGQFVLVGRHFVMREGAPKLPTGEHVYLRMDVPTGRVWLNARQSPGHPGFTLADVPWLN